MSSERPSRPRKTGFRVGPSNAPKDAYLGKAKKIKQDLIDRAKLKRTFAKTLKKEGLTSERLDKSLRDGGWGGMRKGKGREEEDEVVVEEEQPVYQGKREKTKMLSSSDPSLQPPITTQPKKTYNPTSHPSRSHRAPKLPAPSSAVSSTRPSPASQPTRPAPAPRAPTAPDRNPRTDPRLLQKNKKGQPAMKGRMEVLLERIQAGKA